MVNPGIDEYTALGREAEPSVKGFCFALRVQKQSVDAILTGDANQLAQHGTANSLLTPGRQHCHATDMPLGQHAGRANRLAVGVRDEKMQGPLIVFVVFEFDRYALLADKNRVADCEQVFPPRPLSAPVI